MELSTNAVAVIGFVVLFVLMLLRVPVGMAMGLVGVVGYSYIAGSGPALKLVGQTSMRTVTDYTFGVIPMFMLMGAFVSVSGVSRELFRAANSCIGHLRGGLGVATVLACGGFAAICGSSVATAATFSAVAYPAIFCNWRDCSWRHSGRHVATFDSISCLCHLDPTRHWQAVHGRRYSGTSRDGHVCHHHHADRAFQT
jgi:hypothetical protein